MRPRLCLLAALSLALPAGAAAQTLADYDYEYLRFRGIGLGGGYLWSDKIDDTETFHLRLDLGYLGPGVRIVPSVSYWSSTYDESELAELATQINLRTGSTIPPGSLGPIEWSDLGLSIDGHFVWNTPLRMLTYLGAGVGFHALNGQGPAIDDTFVEDLLDSITTGVSGIAGLEFQPVRRLRVYAEGRYTAMNSLQYFAARGGLQFMFFQGRGVRVGAVVPAPVGPEAGEARQ